MLTPLILYLVFLGKLMFRILVGLMIALASTYIFAAGDPQQGKALYLLSVPPATARMVTAQRVLFPAWRVKDKDIWLSS